VHDDEAILDAALELMAETGYQAMSLRDIAERSGVSIPSLYRRWRDKAELVSAAVFRAGRERLRQPTGDLRADLLAQLRDVRRMYETITDLGMVGTLLAEERRHPEFLEAWRRVVIGPRRTAIEAAVQKGLDDGVVSAGTDPKVVGQALLGAYYAARIAGDPLDADWEERVVSVLTEGLNPQS